MPIIEIIVWIALLGGIILAVIYFSRQAGKIGGLSARHDDEESRFADREVQAALADARSVRDSAGGPAPAVNAPPPAPPVEAEPAPTHAHLVVPDALPVGESLGGSDALVRKLRTLRIVVDRQGDLPLSVPPHGVLYSLRRGGTAAILPRFESEAVLAHFAKRYDLVFCPAQDGSVIVMERLEQRLVHLIDDPGG